MAEIVPVTSEALEAQVRDLLPSQRGFGEDLQASNVITPIIDLTAVAQGTTTPTYMQTALAFGSQTSFSITSGSQVLANTPGFYNIYGQLSLSANGTTAGSATIQLSDGLSNKIIFKHAGFGVTPSDVDIELAQTLNITVFLRAGDSVSALVGGGQQFFQLTIRQVADVNGNLVNPAGFTPQ